MNTEMISIEDGFQYSVNIAYDIHNEKKLSSFIPTASSEKLIEEILLSTKDNSTDRAHVLVGAYGKGKSHIVLSILSLLSGTPLTKFSKLQKKIKGKNLERIIENYTQSKKRLLPVLITGTGSSISQNFLLALQRTLSENNLNNLMPDTNYKAAIKTIERWKKNYPLTFEKFKKEINENSENFILRLKSFDENTYRKFEEVYPILTSGGNFNPFLGFDVTEIYESVIKSLKESNSSYSGIFVVYDEFSKYLESNISSATVNDTKMLQDFAEKCNRSGNNQLHLMLICHKEISNYIDTLPKQKVDGWRGISERFKHIHLNNNFAQTYEIIESVILKNEKLYSDFVKNNNGKFENLVQVYSTEQIFNDLTKENLKKIFEGCYPLHPVTLYILPRLSEKVAQNERTLFTFLSSFGEGGLPSFLEKLYKENKLQDFNLLTPDILFDYFEPLFKKEIYTQNLYKTYTLTTILLDKLNSSNLEAKIIKTLSLIYILNQFERLAPTSTTLHHIFETSYSSKEINSALENLIQKECIVYLKRSNNFYSLKQTSGIDINEQIQKAKTSLNAHFSLKKVLNNCNFDKALYPLRYNDENEITRFFKFEFIEDSEISEEVNWKKKSEQFYSDGTVYAILPSKNKSSKEIISILEKTKESGGRCLFILPKKLNDNQKNILEYAKEYEAVKTLIETAGEDNILCYEYEVILNDLQEIILDFINIYTQSEKENSIYIYDGKILSIKRRADVTETLSKICETYFSKTPKIINESINKNEISTAAANARNKIISSLLRHELEKNLGLSGGQELAVMRSLLTKTKIVDTDSENPKINFEVPDKNLCNVLLIIKNFILSSKDKEQNFSILYKDLTTDKKKIGLRKGLIPVFLACVFHEYKKQISIYREKNELTLSTETLCAINENPENFTIKFMDWSFKEDEYINNLSEIFKNYIFENEKTNAYDFVFNAIRRWYMNLPKYTKEMKKTFDGIEVPKKYLNFLKNIKACTNIQDFIFVKLKEFESINEIEKAKEYFDNSINNAIEILSLKVSRIFSDKNNLAESLKKWSTSLKPFVFEKVYFGGTTQFLNLCKNINLNEQNDKFLARQIAYIASDLNIEDWNNSTFESALKNVQEYKSIIEQENEKKIDKENNEMNANLDSSTFEINFISSEGKVKTKRFEKSEKSSRAKMLERSLKSNLDGMGLAVSENEKRQVLMELLLELCGEK